MMINAKGSLRGAIGVVETTEEALLPVANIKTVVANTKRNFIIFNGTPLSFIIFFI